MPELPEVEVIRQDLQAEVVGATILAASVAGSPNARRVVRRHPAPAALEAALAGSRILDVGRRGKNLVLRLDEAALVVHLGMSGQLRLAPAGAPPAPHTHVVLTLDSGPQLRYVDPRAFGQMFVTTHELPELARVGPDPLDGAMTAHRLSSLLAGHRMKVKALLMDQRFVSGIGNIYSDEMLFQARLHPFRMCDSLVASEVRRLHRAGPQVLQAAIGHRGTSAADAQYRDLRGRVGEHGGYLEVYQRGGQACRRCGATIQRARWANRSAHFCPGCQL